MDVSCECAIRLSRWFAKRGWTCITTPNLPVIWSTTTAASIHTVTHHASGPSSLAAQAHTPAPQPCR
ncbi:hypothetical protein E2C01_065884 [Portunus trituberculatus]|uniref:Uncharacterized protein n=1 Tax=Portunus trituberculatus TaxID=210409 RepID=A0A5B7HFR6_PORTR|nr:hypothetical protein [Portunus trituberculatus]